MKMKILKTEKINIWCLGKINKTEKPLAKLTKRKRVDTNCQYKDQKK